MKIKRSVVFIKAIGILAISRHNVIFRTLYRFRIRYPIDTRIKINLNFYRWRKK